MFPVSYLVYSVNNHVCLLTNNKRVGDVNHEIYGPKQPLPLGCALRSFNKILSPCPLAHLVTISTVLECVSKL